MVDSNQWRGSGRGRGGRPWRRTRETVFRRDGFLCQRCKRMGKITPVELHGVNAGECDHIIPECEGGTNHIDNLETLCKSCHAHKTKVDRARATGTTIKDYSNEVGENGWPIDPKHPVNSG